MRAKVSHHLPVCINLDIEVEGTIKTYPKPRVRVNEYLLRMFCKDLEEIENSIDLTESADTCFSSFFDKFSTSYDKWFVNHNTATNKKCINLRKDWITIGIAKSCTTRQALYENWLSNRTAQNWNVYIEYKKKLDRLIDKTKYDYFSKKIDENKHDLKKTWCFINSILGRKRQNRLLTFPEEDAAHSFNKYFVSVANNLILKTYSNNAPDDTDSFRDYLSTIQNLNDPLTILEDYTFEATDVSFFISKLNNSKSTYFSPKILKQVSYNLSPFISKLFNRCLSCGYFLKELKIAKVIPLFKNKGSISDMSNYRPISMLSVFSKIFEKLLHKALTEFLDSYDMLNDSQYGFRKKRTTLHALLNATENIYQASDLKLHT